MESPTAAQRSSTLKALIPCFIGTILLGLASNGVHHDDDLTHYLMARWSRWFPGYLLHVWGRPGATIPMAAVAWIGDADLGWHVCRILSACVTAATAWLAATLAGRKGIGPAWLVVLACYIQPLNTLLAATTLTENYLALYLIAAVLLLDIRRPILASIVFSVALLTRHETLVFVPIWWAAVIWNGECRIASGESKTSCSQSLSKRCRPSLFAVRYSQFIALVVSLWAPIAHNCLHNAAFGKWPARMFLSPKGSTEYVATSLLGYLPAALQAIPPVVFAIAISGAIALLKRRVWLIPAMAAVFLAAHGAITALGVFASGGYPRFMVGIAPFVAILAVAGIQQACAHRQDSRRGAPFWIVLMATWFLGWVALEIERRAGRLSIPHVGLIRAIRFLSAVVIMVCLTRIVTSHISRMWRTVTIGLIVAVTLFQSVVLIQPMRLKPGQRRVRDAATWIHQNQLQGRPIYATNAWFPYFMNFVEDPRVHKGKRLLAAMPAGTLVLWDSIYSDSDYHGVRLADLEADRASYRHVITFDADPNDRQSLRMRLFEKIAETPVPPDPDRPYPPSTSADPETIYTSYYIVP